MILNWSGQPGNLQAVGARGVYLIRSVGRQHILQGRGHDNMLMIALGSHGFVFPDVETAQAHAASLDNEFAEAQVGGE